MMDGIKVVMHIGLLRCKNMVRFCRALYAKFGRFERVSGLVAHTMSKFTGLRLTHKANQDGF